MLHNETVNVWSHLIGAFVFFVMVIYFIAMDEETIRTKELFTNNNTAIPRWPLIVHGLAATF